MKKHSAASWLILSKRVLRYAFLFFHAAVLLELAMGLTANAQVQRMAIPRGIYQIGGGGGGGIGSGTIPSYCMDEHFKAPNPDSSYQTVLAGSDNGSVILPDGRKISLQKALQDGVIKISGADDFDYNHLTLSGPPGAQINIAAPLGLSADSWLERTPDRRFTDDAWKAANEVLKASGQNDDVQSKLWARIEGETGKPGQLSPSQWQLVQAAFGADGVKMLQDAIQNRYVQDLHISGLGKEPVLRFKSSSGPDDFPFREALIRRDGDKLALRELDTDENAEDEAVRQAANIHARLSALATPDTAFIALTEDGKIVFARTGATEPESADFEDIDDFAPLKQWVESHKDLDSGKPKLILVSEDGFGTGMLADELPYAWKEQVRVYEDDDPVLALKNVAAQRRIMSGRDLAVYSDSSIQDGGILGGMDKIFDQSGIKYIKTSQVVDAGNLIIVTGHKDSAYRNYLADLANSGALRGKSVALLSCADEGDQAFSRFLIKQGGATCVFRINDSVDSKAAREVLIHVAQGVQKTGDTGKYLDELLEDAVNAAADDSVDDDFKEKIRVILDHSLQISQIFPGSALGLL